MNEQHDFEHLVADQLAAAGVGAPPESAITDTIARAAGSRRLPLWLALLKEPPMRTNNHLAVGSPTVRVAVVIVATLLLALALAAAGAGVQRLLAADGPIVVAQDGSGDHLTIGQAVAAAEDGDEIVVRPGHYVEAVVIDKDIDLRGDGPVDQIVLSSPEDGPVIEYQLDVVARPPYALLIAENDSEVAGLTLRGSSSQLHIAGGSPTVSGLVLDGVGSVSMDAYSYGVVIRDGSTATFEGNSIDGGGGVAVHHMSEPRIVGNTLAGNGITGGFGDEAVISANVIDLEGANRTGISIWDPTTATIKGNTIRDTAADAIRIPGELDRAPAIIGNTISGSTTAIRSGSSPLVDGNTLEGNGMGILLQGPAAMVTGNTLVGGGTGILVSGGGSPTIEGNAIEGMEERAITVGGNTAPTISGNTFCGNAEDVTVADTADPLIDDSNASCEGDATA